MAEKKNTTSKKRGRPVGSGTGYRLPGTRTRMKPEYPGQDPILIKPGKEIPDPEKNQAPEDAAAKHKYPPPKINPIFRAKWMRFIDNVVNRANFHVSHLDQLEILCDLYVEYDQLQEFIRTHGRTYEVIGRSGRNFKFYPEVQQCSKTQSLIKDYSKMLGLVLNKDKGDAGEGGKSGDEWK